MRPLSIPAGTRPAILVLPGLAHRDTRELSSGVSGQLLGSLESPVIAESNPGLGLDGSSEGRASRRSSPFCSS